MQIAYGIISCTSIMALINCFQKREAGTVLLLLYPLFSLQDVAHETLCRPCTSN